MTLEEILETDGILVYKTKGTSMEPMLRENRDVVVIRKRGNERLKKGDVALYRRPGFKDYILHRVIRVEKQGYTMLGDHQWNVEKHVPDDCILGVLTSFIRDGREIDPTDEEYRNYLKHLTFSPFIRRMRGLKNAVLRRLRKKS